MIIERLRIYKTKEGKEIEDGEIRNIKFSPYLNFITSESIDNTMSNDGNSVGKTTTLEIIDWCLGASKFLPSTPIQDYIEKNEIYAELTLVSSDNDKVKTTIKRALFSNKKISVIDDRDYVESEFNNFYIKLLFDSENNSSLKFRNLIKQFIRLTIEPLEKKGIPNYLHYLHSSTTARDYDFVRLYMFGFKDIDITEKIKKKKEEFAKFKKEKISIKNRLDTKIFEKNYKIKIEKELEELNQNNDSLQAHIKEFDIVSSIVDNSKIASDRESKLITLQYDIDELYRSLKYLEEAKKDIVGDVNVDDSNIIDILEEAGKYIHTNINNKFQEVKIFYDELIKGELEFIENSISELEKEVTIKKNDLLELINSVPIDNSKITTTMAEVIENSNKIGKYSEQLDIINKLEEDEHKIHSALSTLDIKKQTYSEGFEEKLSKFNAKFQEVHENIFHSKSNTKFEYSVNEKNRERGYDEDWGVLAIGKDNNNGAGHSTIRIVIFNLAYNEFAKDNKLQRPEFIIHDFGQAEISSQTKESLFNYIIASQKTQVIIATLKSKELEHIMTKENICLELSQINKLFKI